ncbi:MAG: alpha-galactosidase [Firmicutes bacterium]|nr:alpha-galactosidase [Bacillota bacterium]
MVRLTSFVPPGDGSAGAVAKDPAPELAAEEDPEGNLSLLIRAASSGSAGAMLELCASGSGPWHPGVLRPDGCGAVQMSLGGAVSGRCRALFNAGRDRALEILEPGASWRVDGDGVPRVSFSLATAAGHPRMLVKLKVVENHYRIGQELPAFGPLDKATFPLPPSGWCSWYQLKGGIDEGNVLGNLAVFVGKLKPYGGEYFQVDDGWQGADDQGPDGRRDWWTVNGRKFPHGMKYIADRIHDAGVKAGIWLIPQAQSNPELVAGAPGAFLLRPDGSSVNESVDPVTGGEVAHWMGRYLLDVTHPGGMDLLRRTVRRVAREWGYDYLKIDGQAWQPDLMEEHRCLAHNSQLEGALVYRSSIHAIRSEIGPGRFVLGCLAPWCAADLLPGARTGGDVTPDEDGLVTAMEASRTAYFLHNVVWYSDPDVVMVRPPLSQELARAWATLLATTGQLLMASDDLMALPEDRLRLLQKIFPAADIRPLDLYRYDPMPFIWDLRIHKAFEDWDVVAVMNQGRSCGRGVIDPVALGWVDAGRGTGPGYHVYDFWRGRYHGVLREPVSLLVDGVGAEALTFRQDLGHPQVLSTSRHITQGWMDLEDVAWDEAGCVLSGCSVVTATDPYTVTIVMPEEDLQGNPRCYVPVRYDLEAGGEGREEGNLLHLQWPTFQEERRVRWAVSFAVEQSHPPEPPELCVIRDLQISQEHDLVRLRWTPAAGSLGTAVDCDGTNYGVVLGDTSSIAVRLMRGEGAHSWAVRPVGPNVHFPERSTFAHSRPLPAAKGKWYLADTTPEREVLGGVKEVFDSAGPGLNVAGLHYATAVQMTHRPWFSSWMDYRVEGHRRLTGWVAVPEGKDHCLVEVVPDRRGAFSIEALRSEDGPRPFSIDLTDTQVVRFVASWIPGYPGASSVLWLDVAVDIP